MFNYIRFKATQFIQKIKEAPIEYSKDQLVSKSHEYRNRLVNMKKRTKEEIELIDEIRMAVNEMIDINLVTKPYQIPKAYTDFFFGLAKVAKR